MHAVEVGIRLLVGVGVGVGDAEDCGSVDSEAFGSLAGGGTSHGPSANCIASFDCLSVLTRRKDTLTVQRYIVGRCGYHDRRVLDAVRCRSLRHFCQSCSI